MAKVKVLIEGYAKETKEGWIASSTTVLVQEKGLNIMVDPGINRELLLERLSKGGLKLEDIDFVLMTHFHPDHNYLSGIFPKAKSLDDELVYDGDKEYEHEGKVPGTNLKIIRTPGHEKSHSSLVVPTKRGTMVVAGDVFWWADEKKQDTSSLDVLLKQKDPYVKDKKALKESRRKILKIADWIVPGHGKIFKNPRLRK
ncbi:MAG TPA: MBL fold metallo-hydrolase [Candidatus Bathyarchaeia archaeon]|nr:MBL fold metallo-hydrolase [Candidatus Bathyarchaeia archaeon]